MTRKPKFILLGLLLSGLLAGGARAQTAPVYDSSTNAAFATTHPAVAAGQVLTDNLTDVQGGIWSAAGGTLTATTSDGSGYLKNFLLRPASENALGTGETVAIPPQTTGGAIGEALRFQASTKNFFLVAISGTATNFLQCYAVTSGAVNSLAANNGSPFTYNPSHGYILTATPTGTNPTTINATLSDVGTAASPTAPAVVATYSQTDAAIGSPASLQNAGQTGVVVWTASASLTRIQTFAPSSNPAATGYNASLSAAGGVRGNPVTLTYSLIPLLGASSAGLTITPSEAGPTGTSSPATVTLNSSTNTATQTFTPSANGTATLSFTNSGGFTDNPPLSYYAGVPLVVGFIGDSNDVYTPADGTLSVPQAVQIQLQKLFSPRPVTFVNKAWPGSTTGQWTPGGAYLPPAETAFASAGVQYIFDEQSGTNDCIQGVTPAAFRANKTAMLAELTGQGYKVVENYAPYAVPGGVPFNNAAVTITAAGTALLPLYDAQIDTLSNGTTVLPGDKFAYTYFAAHQGELRDGIHFNAAGVTSIATLRATAFYNVLTPLSAPAPAPVALVVTITHNAQNQPILTWVNDPLATLYLEERSTDGVTYTVFHTDPPGTLTDTDTARPNVATVYYHVVSRH